MVWAVPFFVGLDQDFAACSPGQAKRGEVSSEDEKRISLF
jgi:hypothetical protein